MNFGTLRTFIFNFWMNFGLEHLPSIVIDPVILFDFSVVESCIKMSKFSILFLSNIPLINMLLFWTHFSSVVFLKSDKQNTEITERSISTNSSLIFCKAVGKKFKIIYLISMLNLLFFMVLIPTLMEYDKQRGLIGEFHFIIYFFLGIRTPLFF